MPGDALLEALDHVQETLRGFEVAHVLQDVRLGADQLVRFREIGRAAVADQLPRHPRRQRVGPRCRRRRRSRRTGAPASAATAAVRCARSGSGARAILSPPSHPRRERRRNCPRSKGSGGAFRRWGSRRNAGTPATARSRPIRCRSRRRAGRRRWDGRRTPPGCAAAAPCCWGCRGRLPRYGRSQPLRRSWRLPPPACAPPAGGRSWRSGRSFPG